MLRIGIIALVVSLASACATDEAVDGPNDSFLSDGKADGSIQDGTPEAAGVLRVANELDYSTLHDDVKLAAKAARNIIKVRNGPDGHAGTSDDRTFATLQQLDDVPYVGPISMGKMLAYAISAGWVVSTSDPFDPASCTGTPMTRNQALSYFPAAATEAALAAYRTNIRQRACNTNTGCAAWQPGFWRLKGWFGLANISPIAGILDLNIHGSAIELSPRADLCGVNDTISTCGDVTTATVTCSEPHLPLNRTDPCAGTYVAHLGDTVVPLTGITTDHCTRLSAHASDAPDANGSYTEYEAVVFSTYGSSSCQPLTCAEVGNACGSMADGCGGMLDCGGCSSGQACEHNTCVSVCQCTGGRVCCAGHTGCWDACF